MGKSTNLFRSFPFSCSLEERSFLFCNHYEPRFPVPPSLSLGSAPAMFDRRQGHSTLLKKAGRGKVQNMGDWPFDVSHKRASPRLYSSLAAFYFSLFSFCLHLSHFTCTSWYPCCWVHLGSSISRLRVLPENGHTWTHNMQSRKEKRENDQNTGNRKKTST